MAKWDYVNGKLIDRLPIHYNIGHIMAMHGDTVKPRGKYVVALDKLAIEGIGEKCWVSGTSDNYIGLNRVRGIKPSHRADAARDAAALPQPPTAASPPCSRPPPSSWR